MFSPLPEPDPKTALAALRSLITHRNLLYALEIFHAELGDIFQLNMPGQKAIVLVGPAANRFVLATARDKFLWRMASDPVVKLFGGGVLVQDGDAHDHLRKMMSPPLHRQVVADYTATMQRCTDEVTSRWQPDTPVVMLDEMRKITLKILAETLFAVDIEPDMEQLWQPILKAVQYISPGIWLLSDKLPRLGYKQSLQTLDAYLYRIIMDRRANLAPGATDLLSRLVASGMADQLIRDQLITMIIAGHDTSTALLAWALHLLTTHPDVMHTAQKEVATVLGANPPATQDLSQLVYLEQVINETLRLYPPVHLGSRLVAEDTPFQNYLLPAGARVMYAIYLTHRHPAHWTNPNQFDPNRFNNENKRNIPPYAFLPFGGGPRNCIGARFGQVEAKIVLARIIQRFNLETTGHPVHMSVKATLEPHPGVIVKATRRPIT